MASLVIASIGLIVMLVCTFILGSIRGERLAEIKAQKRKCGTSCCSGDSGQLEELRDRNDPLVEETPSKD